MRAVPGPSARLTVSVDGGTDPVFSKVGMSVYYRAPGHMAVAHLDGSALKMQRTDTLFPDVYETTPPSTAAGTLCPTTVRS